MISFCLAISIMANGVSLKVILKEAAIPLFYHIKLWFCLGIFSHDFHVILEKYLKNVCNSRNFLCTKYNSFKIFVLDFLQSSLINYS